MPKQPDQRPESDWEYFRTLYITGASTASEIARKYGVNYHTLNGRIAQHGWRIARDQYLEKFAANEETHQQALLADVRRMLSDALRRLCEWYTTRLEEHEIAGSVGEFPIDEWLGKVEKFQRVIESMARLRGVSPEAVAVALQQNFNVNLQSPNGHDDEGPPGIRLDRHRMEAVVVDLLAHVTQQAKPAEEKVVDVEAQPKGMPR